MKVNRTGNHTLQQTLDEIKRLSSAYRNDVIFLKDRNIYEIFDLISKKVKFRKDPENIELVMRPKFTLQRMEGDCDDKTVLFLAWLLLKGYPCGYSIVSSTANKPFHHIFPFMFDPDNHKKIIDLDATYAHNKIGNSKYWSKRKNYYLR